MTWYTLRLDLARSAAFPEGSAAHCYLLRAPLTDEGTIDADALHAHPEQATVLRSWPDEPERRGYLIRQRAGWRFSYARGDDDDEPIFHLETHPLDLGAYLTVHEPDGGELCFRVTRRDEISVPA
jgi:hypothetical protein